MKSEEQVKKMLDECRRRLVDFKAADNGLATAYEEGAIAAFEWLLK